MKPGAPSRQVSRLRLKQKASSLESMSLKQSCIRSAFSSDLLQRNNAFSFGVAVRSRPPVLIAGRTHSPQVLQSLLSMSSFLFADAALAGFEVLSVVDRKDSRMFASVEVVFAVPSDRMGGSDPIRAGVPARTHRWTASGIGVLDHAPATMRRNGSFGFHMA